MRQVNTRMLQAIWAILVLALSSSVGAQPRQPAPCFALVQTALQAADSACEATGRNQVCYGNVLGLATPAAGVTELMFEQVGDIAPLHSIKALQLSPLDEVKHEWGVAVMRLQANLPDSLPGQNVTFILFGDVTIEDAVDDQVRVEGRVRATSNVRHLPSGTADVVGSLRRGQLAIATGKAISSTGSLWYRVKYDQYRTRTGWVLGELIDVDPALLPDVDRASLVANPMQAFYFKTGIGRQTCEEAPADGVVVQTPDGVGMVAFNVNGVDVSLGSTAVITNMGDGLSFALMEGRGMVRAQGIARVLVPGSQTVVAMDEANRAAAAPSMPQPIAEETFAMASQAMAMMDQPVEVPAPAAMRAIEAANLPGAPVTLDLNIVIPTCPPGADPALCRCPDVDADGQCDAVPCSAQYPTMCIPGCADDDRDGKCDTICEDRDRDGVCDSAICMDLNLDGQCDGANCEDRDADGRCDVVDPCVDLNNNGVCDVDEAVCTLADCTNCTDRDADGRCDDIDPCVDSDSDGVCETCLGLPCSVLPTLIPTLPGLPGLATRTPTPSPTRTPAPAA